MSFLRKKISLVLILVFVFSLNAGMAGMHTDHMGNMTNCPFMGKDVICHMGLFEHIEVMRSTSAGLPSKNIFFSMIFASIIVSIAVVPKIASLSGKRTFFIKRISPRPSFNKVLAALSDGIIQPKLYV